MADKNDTTLAEAISQLAAVMKEQKAGTADAISAAIKNSRTDTSGLSPDQVARLEGLPQPKKWREVECVSDESGATFTAQIVESKFFKNGRIVGFKDYRHPPGAVRYVSDGGLVPDGKQIMRAGTGAPQGDPNLIPKHDYTPHYLQWRYEEFFQKDSRRYMGKELKPHLAVDQAAFLKPWNEGKVRLDLNEDTAA